MSGSFRETAKTFHFYRTTRSSVQNEELLCKLSCPILNLIISCRFDKVIGKKAQPYPHTHSTHSTLVPAAAPSNFRPPFRTDSQLTYSPRHGKFIFIVPIISSLRLKPASRGVPGLRSVALSYETVGRQEWRKYVSPLCIRLAAETQTVRCSFLLPHPSPLPHPLHPIPTRLEARRGSMANHPFAVFITIITPGSPMVVSATRGDP